MTMTTTPTKAATKTARAPRRTSVPAPEASPSTSSALDELTATGGLRMQQVPIALCHPHPDNPRQDLGDLTELADSIRAHGVRQNLLLVPHPDLPGEYWIVIGHRRRAASELADRTEVPAVVDTTLTRADQLQLMLLENLQRTDLTPVEEARGYQGLLDLGETAATIAARTGRSRSTVDSRLRLLGLPAAAQDKLHAHQTSLTEVAELDRFADHPEVLDDLASHLGEADFRHYAQRLRIELDRADERAATTKRLEEEGVRIVKGGDFGDPPKGVVHLRQLTNKPNKAKPWESPEITLAAHKKCPGHVAWIPPYTPEAPLFGCDSWQAHHHKRYPTAAAAPVDPAERKRTIENNKAAAAAEVVRREWIRTELLTRTKMPADAVTYVAQLIYPGGDAHWREQEMFDSLVYGGKALSNAERAADRAIPGRAMPLLVALAAARTEVGMDKTFWRDVTLSRAVHLETLVSWGYVPSDVEREYIAAFRGRTLSSPDPEPTSAPEEDVVDVDEGSGEDE